MMIATTKNNLFTAENGNRLLKEAKTNPQSAMINLFNLFSAFPRPALPDFISSVMSKHEYILGEFMRHAHTYAEPLNDLIKSEHDINVTGYSDWQVDSVLKGYLEHYSANTWVTFDSVSLSVRPVDTQTVTYAIRHIYRAFFTPVQLAIGMMNDFFDKLTENYKKLGIFKYQTYQASDMLMMIGKHLPLIVDKKHYIKVIRQELNSKKFADYLQNHANDLSNYGKHWQNTLKVLRANF